MNFSINLLNGKKVQKYLHKTIDKVQKYLYNVYVR